MNIIDLLSRWVSDPKNKTLGKRTSDYSKSDYHYFIEIVRYSNQIRFIANKTRRSIPEHRKLEIGYYLYFVYRYFWEKGSYEEIIADINHEISSEDKKTLLAFYNRLLTWDWDISFQNKSRIEVLSIKYASPTFFIQKLLPVLDYRQIQQNIVAMDQRSRKGTIYLRINDLKKSDNEIIDGKDFFINYFDKKGVRLKSVENYPLLLQVKVRDKMKIVTDSYYKQKNLLFQEKASVASVYLLEPQSGEIIADLCAAPGTKTSLVSQMLTGESTIIAGDYHHQRMNDMVTFLPSLGINDVHTIQWDGIQPPLMEESVDRILLDAPCTGSGTFTSNPELKWRQSDKFLRRNVLLQHELLKAAIRLLKVGGTLVYSTCSLYPEEGEYQIQKLINSSKKQVTLTSVPSWLPPSYKINGSYIEGAGRFLPSEHNTIGFFVAKLIKNK